MVSTAGLATPSHDQKKRLAVVRAGSRLARVRFWLNPQPTVMRASSTQQCLSNVVLRTRGTSPRRYTKLVNGEPAVHRFPLCSQFSLRGIFSLTRRGRMLRAVQIPHDVCFTFFIEPNRVVSAIRERARRAALHRLEIPSGREYIWVDSTAVPPCNIKASGRKYHQGGMKCRTVQERGGKCPFKTHNRV